MFVLWAVAWSLKVTESAVVRLSEEFVAVVRLSEEFVGWAFFVDESFAGLW